MSRFESVMISRARTVKIEDLEKELDEEVKELNNVDQDRSLDIDNAKLSRAKRERDLAKLIQTKPSFESPFTLTNRLRHERERRKIKVKTPTEMAHLVVSE